MEGLDGLIERLLEVRKNRGKRIQLVESEIRNLCSTAKDLFLSQPNLLELEAPINVCGELIIIHSCIHVHIIHKLIDCFFRGHTRAVSRPVATVRVRWFSAGFQLSIPGRLRGQRKAERGDHMSAPGLQDQIPRELLPSPRKPRVCLH